MMERYPRKPALLVLLMTVAIGSTYLTAWRRVEASRASGNTVEALEKKIADEKAAGKPTAATWQAYGDALMEGKQYAKAAVAFQEALQLAPRDRAAKFQRGLALALANDADGFYAFQRELVYSEPKLATEIFDRAEAQSFRKDARFAALAQEAKHQAMD